DLHRAATGAYERAVEVAENPVRECQRGGEDDVYAARSDRLLAAGSLRIAADEPHAADAVAADVHQRPAVEGGVKAGISGAALCRAAKDCLIDQRRREQSPLDAMGLLNQRARAERNRASTGAPSPRRRTGPRRPHRARCG